MNRLRSLAALPLILLLAGCPPPMRTHVYNNSGIDLAIRARDGGQLEWRRGETLHFITHQPDSCEPRCHTFNELAKAPTLHEGRDMPVRTFELIDASGACRRYNPWDPPAYAPEYNSNTWNYDSSFQLDADFMLYMVAPQRAFPAPQEVLHSRYALRPGACEGYVVFHGPREGDGG